MWDTCNKSENWASIWKQTKTKINLVISPSGLNKPPLACTEMNSIFLDVLQQNLLYRAACFAKFKGILGFSVPSIILVKAGLMQITM